MSNIPKKVREAMKVAIDNPDVGENERLYIWYPQYRTREQTADMIIDAALSALREAGYAVVPKEANAVMIEAAYDRTETYSPTKWSDMWRAMLSAYQEQSDG